MDAPPPVALADLARACWHAPDTSAALEAALPALARRAGAEAALVARPRVEGWEVTTASGMHLDPTLPGGDAPADGFAPLQVPATWQAAGITAAAAHALPDRSLLVLAWSAGGHELTENLDAELAVLDSAVARCHAEHRLADLVARVGNAQLLANMGDYDWHIASDTNTWSDQLYRIYGYEPQSFNPSYDRFLAHIHPADRDRVAAIHQQSYATGEPYQMIERIVRPDGGVRYLLSNGQVLRDENATPLRFRGTCIDITDRVLAEQERERLADTMAEARIRRRQALEINDNVVQGLTAAIFATELGETDRADDYLRRTLEAARTMMNDWLRPLEGGDAGEVQPGDLVRSAPSTLHSDAPPHSTLHSDAPPHSPLRPRTPQHPDGAGVRRVLIADDYEDMRQLLSLQLEGSTRYRVVGEACDGAEAVELARALQPDVVVLDLAMPTMDGLEALPLIRDAVDGVHVVALSGFHEPAMIEKVLAAGAARYVQKGAAMNLAAVLDEVLATA